MMKIFALMVLIVVIGAGATVALTIHPEPALACPTANCG